MRSDLVTKCMSLNPTLYCIRYLSTIHYNKEGIFMFNSFSWQSHDEFHISFKNFKAKRPFDLRVLLWNYYSKERHKLMSFNLDPVREYLSRFYSITERSARHQAQILRSLILFALLFNRTDARLCLTVWIREVLPSNPVFIAFIGCRCADGLPPFGSYFFPCLTRP